MIANMLFNSELVPYVLLEDPVPLPIPITLEWEGEGRPRPMSLAFQPAKTYLPKYVWGAKDYNRFVKPNGHGQQPQKLLTATTGVAFSPWLLPYRAIDVYMDGVINTFVDITRLKRSEEKLRQNQQQLESLNKNLEDLVAQRTEQVRKLASEVLITEQKVQQAISQLLHEELQQILVSIQIQTALLSNTPPVSTQALQDQLREIRAAVDMAFQVTRQVATDLTPPLLWHQNFIESLDFLAVMMQKRHGLTVALKVTPLPNWPREEVCNVLLQIVRELLFNVVKYAGVKEAIVEVSEEDAA